MSTLTSRTRTLPPSQRISPQKFAHVVLKTANFNDVIDWYATVLQARVAFRNDFIAFHDHFFKNRHMSGIFCGIKVDETGRRTTAMVSFNAAAGSDAADLDHPR